MNSANASIQFSLHVNKYISLFDNITLSTIQPIVSPGVDLSAELQAFLPEGEKIGTYRFFRILVSVDDIVILLFKQNMWKKGLGRSKNVAVHH